MRGTTLRQLRAFSLVAQHHSFAQAATELHLTPSAVSLQIKELEQALRMSLFARNGKAVTLTPAGELLLVDVRRALQALQHAGDTLGRLRGKEPRAVSIGMVRNAKYFLPRLLAHFHNEHRDVELHLTVGNREQIVDQLRHGVLDLAVMGEPPRELEARGEAFATQSLGIIAAPQHLLSGQSSIPAAALEEHEFIVREPGSGTRAAMERFFREGHIVPPRVMEVSSNEAIKQAVMANMGLAFVSLQAARLELQARLLLALDVAGLPLLRRWFVVNMDATLLTGVAETLRRFILEHGDGSMAQPCEGCADATSNLAGPAALDESSRWCSRESPRNTLPPHQGHQ